MRKIGNRLSESAVECSPHLRLYMELSGKERRRAPECFYAAGDHVVEDHLRALDQNNLARDRERREIAMISGKDLILQGWALNAKEEDAVDTEQAT